MAQIGLAGVSAALPFVTGPTPAEVPSRRVQDQQSSRPVRETDEADDGGDQGSAVIVEEPLQNRRAQSQQPSDEEIARAEAGADDSGESQPGEQLDIII